MISLPAYSTMESRPSYASEDEIATRELCEKRNALMGEAVEASTDNDSTDEGEEERNHQQREEAMEEERKLSNISATQHEGIVHVVRGEQSGFAFGALNGQLEVVHVGIDNMKGEMQKLMGAAVTLHAKIQTNRARLMPSLYVVKEESHTMPLRKRQREIDTEEEEDESDAEQEALRKEHEKQ